MRKKTVRTWIVLLCAVTLPLAAPVSDKVQARGEAGTDGNRSTVDYSSSRSIFEQGCIILLLIPHMISAMETVGQAYWEEPRMIRQSDMQRMELNGGSVIIPVQVPNG